MNIYIYVWVATKIEIPAHSALVAHLIIRNSRRAPTTSDHVLSSRVYRYGLNVSTKFEVSAV